MKNLLSLSASFLVLHAVHAVPPPDSNGPKTVEEFERAYHNSLGYQFENSIRLIGYKKIKIPRSEWSDFDNNPFDDFIPDGNETNRHNTYFDAPSAMLRIYFPVEDAILNHNGGKIEANDLGEFNLNKVNGDYAVLGRNQTDDITGVKGNIIKDGIIWLDPPVLPVRQYDSKIYIYDFGIKSHFHHHDPRPRVKRAWWNPLDWVGGAEEGDDQGEEDGTVGCYANHNKQTCTKKFGIRNGRCPYNDDKTCMDYNGYFTNCKNLKRNFIGSDCFDAMSDGHCWNEVM